MDSRFDILTLGVWPQGKCGAPSPLKWQILQKEGDAALLLCKDIIARMPFDGASNNYAHSHIRKWLNGEFADLAFSPAERDMIVPTYTDNGLQSTGDRQNRNLCPNTWDEVFLLSWEEAFKKFGLTDADRQKVPCGYAQAAGAYVLGGKGVWWLRSPDYDNRGWAYAVGYGGTLFSCGVEVKTCGVVPAVRIKL